MQQGDAIKCRVWFRTPSGEEGQAGLVCWQDRNMVYCLSNDSNNHDFDQCSRRGLGGLVRIPRPLSIANYNKYMGGVDLADMRRLHCNSTFMGQKRWWLKLFFICSMWEPQCTCSAQRVPPKQVGGHWQIHTNEHCTVQNETCGQFSWKEHRQPIQEWRVCR
jgi:hypothetical protein